MIWTAISAPGYPQAVYFLAGRFKECRQVNARYCLVRPEKLNVDGDPIGIRNVWSLDPLGGQRQ